MNNSFLLSSLGAVFFDIDGTLVTTAGELLPSTKKGISILQRHGIPCCLASGRATFGALHLMNELNITAPCMFHSGAAIVDPKTLKPLLELPLQKTHTHRLIAECKAANLYLELYSLNEYFTEVENDLTHLHTELLKQAPKKINFEELLKSEEIIKGVIVADGDAEREKISKMSKVLSDFHFGTAPGSTRPSISFSNVTSNEASRDRSFDWFSEHLDLTNKHTISFGDAASDVPFFKRSTIGIAMQNASKSVQEAAHMVTDSNEADGIWNALQRLFPKEFT